MAILMAGILAGLALAVDLGMALTARSEAQRIADAAALAGGSAFLELSPTAAEPVAEERAYDYALRNMIRGEVVDSSQVTVQVLRDSMKVRVWVTRSALPTWFATIFGTDDVDVGAMAAAEAVQAGAARCLKPFAVPDVWHDADDDANGNRFWDEGEAWDFGSSDLDRYQPFTGDDAPDASTATGYGSGWRDNFGQPSYTEDFGRRIQVKYTDPNSEFQLAPSIFLPWRIPEDPDIEACDRGGTGGNDAGAATYRRNICSCNRSKVELGVGYPVEPGNMVGPTNQGVDELVSEDPDAYWDESAYGGQGGVVNSAFEGPLASPRVVKVALFDPRQVTKGGMQDIVFNNFALIFIEGQDNRRDPVRARFMYFAGGEEGSEGSTTGSLVLYLRLVE